MDTTHTEEAVPTAEPVKNHSQVVIGPATPIEAPPASHFQKEYSPALPHKEAQLIMRGIIAPISSSVQDIVFSTENPQQFVESMRAAQKKLIAQGRTEEAAQLDRAQSLAAAAFEELDPLDEQLASKRDLQQRAIAQLAEQAGFISRYTVADLSRDRSDRITKQFNDIVTTYGPQAISPEERERIQTQLRHLAWLGTGALLTPDDIRKLTESLKESGILKKTDNTITRDFNQLSQQYETFFNLIANNADTLQSDSAQKVISDWLAEHRGISEVFRQQLEGAQQFDMKSQKRDEQTQKWVERGKHVGFAFVLLLLAATASGMSAMSTV